MEKNRFLNNIDDSLLKKRTKAREVDIRGDYYRDQTAILHSLPFRRLKRKTQVFFAPTNDHICTRIEHVLHVTSVATTICKGLNLDPELAQAISLGHDLGHPPFGHVGEFVLSALLKNTGKKYNHEIYSYRIVEYIANKGQGLNLCYAVKNGIISHCGEKFEQFIQPDFTYHDLEKVKDLNLLPCTFEGCIVRLSDKISYLGRDIEDAIRLGIVNKNNISDEILDIFGVNFNDFKDSINKIFINRMIIDAIEYSRKTKTIGLSNEAFNIMLMIRDYNYKNIYNSDIIRDYNYYVKKVLLIIYGELYDLIDKFKLDYSKFSKHFIKPFRDFARFIKTYKEFYENTKADSDQIITDYIAGMTDNYALNFCKDVIIPKRIF